MEGRWAKLTLCAHALNLIDLNKPIKPLAEKLLFRHIEAKWELDIAKIYPIRDDDHIYYINREWLNAQKSCILYQQQEPSKSDLFSDKIEKWKILNNLKET